MRDINEIRADLDAAKTKADRLGREALDILRGANEIGSMSPGEGERVDRLQRGQENALQEVARFESEWRDAIERNMRAGYVENGDGARVERDRGVDNLSRGLTQAGRPYNRRDEGEYIDRAKRVVDQAHRQLPAEAGDFVDGLLRADPTNEYDPGYIARRILVTETPAYKTAFLGALSAAQHGLPAILSAEETDALRAYQMLERTYERAYGNYIARAASENTTTAGGFGVPALVDPSIIFTSGAADVPLLRVCRVEQVTTNLWQGISSAGMTWSYDTEAAEVSDDAATLAKPTVTVHMARGYIPYSIEVGMDYPNFANEMGRLLNQGYSDLLASKTMVGSGSGEPFGYFTALDANTNDEVTPTTDGAFGAVDVFKVFNALPERFRSRATWIMSISVESAIRSFASAAGSSSSYFTVDLTADGITRINGRPTIVTDYAPTFSGSVPGTTGAANILIVADCSNYLWASRAGMSIETVPLIIGSSQRPTGQRGLFAWSRNGGDSVNDLGARLLQNQ